jgi:hypothetical protein
MPKRPHQLQVSQNKNGAGDKFDNNHLPLCSSSRPFSEANQSAIAKGFVTLSIDDGHWLTVFYLITRSPKYGKFMVLMIGLIITFFLPA